MESVKWWMKSWLVMALAVEVAVTMAYGESEWVDGGRRVEPRAGRGWCGRRRGHGRTPMMGWRMGCAAAKWGLTGRGGWGSLKSLSKAAVVAEDGGHFSFAAFAKMKLIG